MRTNCTRTRGKTNTLHRDPTDPPRRRANKRKGYGTYANDRPLIISVVSRDTGEQCLWVCNHARSHTRAALMADNVPAVSAQLSTDEWQSGRDSHPAHATMRHGVYAWARNDDGDSRREVHGRTCEGAARHFGPTGVPSAGSISNTCISMWRPTKPWFIPNGSHPC